MAVEKGRTNFSRNKLLHSLSNSKWSVLDTGAYGKWTEYIIKLFIHICSLIIKEEIIYLGDGHMVGVKEMQEQVLWNAGLTKETLKSKWVSSSWPLQMLALVNL